jgi:methanogenic corrinoid protein MtbC1
MTVRVKIYRKEFSSMDLSEKDLKRKKIIDSIRTRIKPKELLDLSLAIIDGNDETAADLSKAAINAGFSVNQLLNACYEAAKAAGKLYPPLASEKRSLLMAVESYLSAIAALKEKLKTTIKPGTVLLGAMESDGEEGVTLYTLPLLEAFCHRTILVASFYPEWYIEETRERKPDVLCITSVWPSAKFYIANIIEALKSAHLYDKVTILGCGRYLTKKEALLIGCHKYADNYLQIPQIVNEIIKKKK